MRIKNIVSILSSPREFILVVRIYLFVLAIPFLIEILSIQSVVSLITPRKGHPMGDSLTESRVIYLCSRVQGMLGKVGIEYSCLRRSFLLFHFLRYYGQEVAINFGVKWEGIDLTGHSWLSMDGRPYLEPAGKAEEFTAFLSFPTSGSEAGIPEDSKDLSQKLESRLYD
jgi:hypothetical protein